MLYIFARKIWDVTKCVTGIIIAILIGYVVNVAVMQAKDIPATALVIFVNWLLLPGLNRTLTLSILIALFAVTVLSGIVTAIGEHRKGEKDLKKYLRNMQDKHHDLKPAGFAQQSALISVSVPLDEVFIQLRAVADRPRYDLPMAQMRELERVRSRSDLSPEQREEQIQNLRAPWYSQLGQDWLEDPSAREVTITDVVRQLSAERPGAVILGAPGSGKSTTMRWFAYHMAHAYLLPRFRRWSNAFLHFLSHLTHTSLAQGYALPDGLAPAQIPILVHINDYAEALHQGDVPFLTFLLKFIEEKYPDLPRLPNRLLEELQQGHCLLLFDGLDEVACDEVRRLVATNIAAFIERQTPEKPTAHRYNRFIVTSRIVGYEVSCFSNDAHYTLQDLEEKQIVDFLTKWCPLVERYQATFAQSMKKLTLQQRQLADREGEKQKNHLLEALSRSVGIKRLAVNPLMLTILALIQRSGKKLPHSRIDLYQIVTRTLLENWNQDTGRRVFTDQEIPLAEELLAHLAFELHTTDRLLTEAKVKEISSAVMSKCHNEAPKDTVIKQFINTLRLSSGLFVEGGQGLFTFMHRTFQEYYAGRYLWNKPFDDLQQFVRSHCHTPIWHEPFLLIIAYKSTQTDLEKQQANKLIGTIKDTSGVYDAILHRNLILAARSIVDCNVWTIECTLQQDIANQLFNLYGDAAGAGRYTQLQKDIEETMLLWLHGQYESSTGLLPPFLKAWRTALCDATNPVRQEGAIHLLASLALELSSCRQFARSVLLPPLLKLVRFDELADFPSPLEVRTQLSRTVAHPASLNVEEYALVTLRLLDKNGPAGWLHEAWLKWSQEQPELLNRLTEHSLEIDYLLMPAAFPARYDLENPHCQVQLKLSNEWKQRQQRNPLGLQNALLQASDTARYPHAYLYWICLKAEEAAPDTPWREIWDTELRKEMSRGCSVTYQTCLHLRLLLCKDDQQQREQIANEIRLALSPQSSLQPHALVAITILSLLARRDRRDLLDLLNLLNPHYLRGMRVQYIRDLQQSLQNSQNPQSLQIPQYMQYMLNLRDLRYLRENRYLRDLRDLRYLLNLRDLRYLLDLRDLRDLHNPQDLRYLLNLLNHDEMIDILCDNLPQQGNALSTSLFALYSVLNSYDAIPPKKAQCVQRRLQYLEQRMNSSLTIEHRQLIAALRWLIDPQSSSAVTYPSVQRTPDERAIDWYAFQSLQELTKSQVEELLSGCTDTRQLEEATREQVGKAYWVDAVAWNVLSRQRFQLKRDVVLLLRECLEHCDARICAASALLLQHGRMLPQDTDVCQQAAQKVMEILQDDKLSRRPLDTPGHEVWRLDDVLFETLKELAE